MGEQGRLRWGIIGPGAIARTFAAGLNASRSGTLVAVASRSNGKAAELATAFPGVRILSSYEALLADAEIEAIYISTPHPSHAEWAIKAAEAGKHVLVEKPLALSAVEADAVFHAASKAGVFAGEAFMYRLHPFTGALRKLISDGEIGDVRMIQSSMGYKLPGFDPAHRLVANDLAGGGIMDLGCYPVSMARLIAGAAAGKPFLDPIKVAGLAQLGRERTDEWAAALLQFENGIVAQVSCAVFCSLENVLRIHGSTGRIEVPNFWFAGAGRDGGASSIEIIRGDKRETVALPDHGHVYAFEADAAAVAIRDGRTEFAAPGMSWEDTLGNLRTLDLWRAEVNLAFDLETSPRRTNTVSGRPLGRLGGQIPKRALKNLDKAVSAVGLGIEPAFRSFPSAFVMLDAFWEAGGNLFDTAFGYGNGKIDSVLGEWLKTRGVRDQAVILAKGAHTPLCYPEIIGQQLAQSLEKLGTDHVDVYFMHRDNLSVPVGEFVDAIAVEIDAGRIRGPYGGSNWTQERMDEAIAYAERHGKPVPSALSNNFSLAEMVVPIWPGCIASSSALWRQWLEQRQVANFAWSSQARGFFTDRAGPDKQDNPEMVRVWYSALNFARRERAIELAAQLGKNPIQVALAYVLAQSFPSFALIGPRRLSELDDSLSATQTALTPEQVAWLEDGTGQS